MYVTHAVVRIRVAVPLSSLLCTYLYSPSQAAATATISIFRNKLFSHGDSPRDLSYTRPATLSADSAEEPSAGTRLAPRRREWRCR
jgi:hypothetical protein